MQAPLQRSAGEKLFLIAGTIMVWFALIFQFYLAILNRNVSVTESVIRFFSFFTILSNILIALYFTFRLIRRASSWGSFFSRPSVIAALTVYIAVVGITYNGILRFLWAPQGLQRIVDELLHLINPIWFILYWILFAPKSTLQWKNILPWLIFPVVYCVYSFIRGALTGYYPYPFLDVNILGYDKVLVNVAGMIALFIGLSFLIVAIGRASKKPAL